MFKPNVAIQADEAVDLPDKVFDDLDELKGRCDSKPDALLGNPGDGKSGQAGFGMKWLLRLECMIINPVTLCCRSRLPCRSSPSLC